MPDLSFLGFEEIASRLRGVSSPMESSRLSIPERVHPFVPPPVRLTSHPASVTALECEVLLFSAPAAVGKTTFARALAAHTRVPLLDLAKVHVGVHSLRGVLSAELGPTAPEEFLRGELCIIVDALDEGRILSNDRNFEEFLITTAEFLAEGRINSQQAPKLLLFGRTEAAKLASYAMEIGGPDIRVADLLIDYFDEATATQLVLEVARSKDAQKTERYQVPIHRVIALFFDAIGKAIGVSGSQVWKDTKGRSFAGYAPVLGALGSLVAVADDYQKLQQRLSTVGTTDAWDVLQEVADEVLSREAAKVRDPLVSTLGSDLPVSAYDVADQLRLLAAHLSGQSIRPSPQLRFGSPAAANAYMEAVRAHLPEHPFLRQAVPVNNVLGALIIAYAIAQGIDLLGGQAPHLLATYSRQPFLWRFLRGRLPPDPLVGGEVVSHILGSLWSDELTQSPKAKLYLKDGAPRLLVETGEDSSEISVAAPIILHGEVRNFEAELPGESLVLRGWPDSHTRSLRLLGETVLRTGSMRFEVDRLEVGALDYPATCNLAADETYGDERLTIEVKENSSIAVGGVLRGRYPWVHVATEPPEPPKNLLAGLLAECERRLPGGIAVVTNENYSLTDDPRVDWARRYSVLFPRLMKALVEGGLATTDRIQAAGDEPRMRVRPNFRWADLRRAYEEPGSRDERFRSIFDQFT